MVRNATLILAAIVVASACGDDVSTIEGSVRENGGQYTPRPFGFSANSTAIVTPEIIIAPEGTDEPNPALCGDGVLDQDELCDPSIHACCNARCDGLRAPGEQCRESAGSCDASELCDGDSFLCPDDAPADEGVVCRASAGGCDPAESCDGESIDCPEDALEEEGTLCRDADGVCDVAESCSGDSAQCPDDGVVGTDPMEVCRAADGDLACDAVEYCDGESKDCPADAPLPDGTQCQTSLGTCDAAEVCDGDSFECPAPTGTAAGAGTVCRISAGPCDVVEQCNGRDITCPLDGFRANSFECRPDSALGCDVAERCTGETAACPANGFRTEGTSCRVAAAGGCDVAESCTGGSDACPPDGFQNNTVCRAAVAGGCDVEERCPGTGVACPADGVRPVGTECRAEAAGGCDVAETCTGSNTCPANAFVSATTVCRAAVAGGCDREELCPGGSAQCPADVVEPNRTVCRPAAAGGCDLAEICDGSSNSCPANGFASATTVCRAAAAGDLCDAAETCSGSTAACPSNGRIAEGGACNMSRGQCSRDVCCPGETLNPGTDECSIGASNLVFVTSMDVDGSIPGVAAADTMCNSMANGANLAGTYHAWLSSGAVGAPAPLHARARVSAGPYVLVNGVMFSDSLNALTRGGMPDAALNRTEWNEVRDVPVWTATQPTGTFDTSDCAAWSAAASTATGDVGRSGVMTGAWTENGTRACNATAALYCFQDDCPNLPNVDFMTDRNNCGACGNVCTVACINGSCGARAFVTSIGFTGSLGGLTGADNLCNERAARGSRTGTYRAFLSQGATAAASRVLDTSYYRFDDRRVARNRAQLINTSTTPLDNPLSITETGNEINAAVWTGTIANGMPAVEFTCNVWNTVDATGLIGHSNATSSLWISDGSQQCGTPASLYCFQVAP